MTKREMLDKLYSDYKSAFAGKEIVLGDGNIDTRLILVGEAPGRDEVRLSKPFVGAAGKNLAEFLELVEIERDSIYITNAIKYRLSKVNERTGRTINRPATKDEIETNRKYLLEEIRIIKPDFIVTLGAVPLKSVTGDYSISMGGHHGKLERIMLMGHEYFLFPLYHPASIIYNRELKDVYIKDIKKLSDLMKNTVKI